MDDLISRQEAINAVDDYIGTFDAIDVNFLDGLKTAKKLMMQLPSAQSTQTNAESTQKCVVSTQDCVSRHAAIDIVEESRRHNPHKDAKSACNHEYEHRHIINLLQELPPAQCECREECIDWRVPLLLFILNIDEEALRTAVKMIQEGRNGDK